MEVKGQIITASISSIKNIECDEIWRITRVNTEISGTIWVPELAPSSNLYNKYLKEWKNKPGETWWAIYEKKFREELLLPTTVKTLRKLWRLAEQGRRIALVCFCVDSRYCHRRLVGDFFEMHGMRVEEITKTQNNSELPIQIELF